jgi:hypothetical protein
MNEMITLEDLLVYFHDELKQQPISGYTPEYDSMSDTLGWSKGGDGPIIWATPKWDETTITPFDIQYPDTGDYETYCEVDFSDRSHDEQYKIYFTILVLVIEYLESKDKVTEQPTLRIV